MKNTTIALVVRTPENIYRPISIGDIVNENEHVENKVTVTEHSTVFFLKSKDGPGIPTRPGRRLGELRTFYGRILAIQHPDVLLYVWAGKNPETHGALQRVEVLCREEFELVVGEAVSDVRAAAEEASTPASQVALRQGGIRPCGPVGVALEYIERLKSKKAGAMLVSKMELLRSFGYSRAKKNNSREIQSTLEDLGIAVIPDIYQNTHDRLLLATYDGYLCTLHPELLGCDDPYEVIEEALEYALA